MSSLQDEMLKKMLSDDSPTIEDQVEQAEAKAEQGQNLYWRDMGSAMYDWAVGAVQGAEEVGRAASNRGANVPADYLDEQALEKPELTPEQQQSEDWYQKAVDKYNEESTQPLLVAAALSGIPGVSQFGAMGMLPMLAKDLQSNVEKEGVVGGTTSTVLNLLPFIGSYRMTQDPNFQKFAEVHPARASGLLVMNEAPWLATGIQIAKVVDREALIKKFNGNMEKVLEYERKVKAQKNLEKAAEGEKPVVAEKAAKDTEVKMNKEAGTKEEFKVRKPRNEAEEVNMAENPEVSKEIDDTFVKARLEQETADFEANRVHKGAYGMDIEATPPTNVDLGRVTIPKIWETVNKIVPARVGNMMTRAKRVLGHFRPKEGIVNVRDTLNLDTLSHEVGHYIDTVLNIVGHDEELVKAAKSRWGEGAYKKHEWRGEGIAEFTTEYVLNPDVARQNFPGYYEAFTKAIADHPELAADFELLCQQVRTWKHMRPEERVRGNMVFDGDIQKGFFQKVKDTFDNVRNAWQDEHASLKDAISDFVDSVGITLLDSDNPALNATAVKNWIPARATMLLGFFSNLTDDVALTSLEKIYQVPLKKITLGTIYGKLRELNLNKDILKYYTERGYSNIHEAFAAYSLAVHALDVIPVKNAERIAGLTEKLKGYQQQLAKLMPVEGLDKEIRQLMSDISDPANAAKLPELRQKVAEKIELKKALEKQTKTDAELKAIEALKKKIDKKEAEIKAIQDGLDDYKTFADKDDLKALVDNAPAEFKEVLKDLSDFTENYMTLAVHFGFVTAEEAATLRKQYPHYVPMHRDFSLDRLVVNPGGGKGTGSGFVDVMSPIMALKEKGSTRTVIDPISELYKATQNLISAGERNKVGQLCAKLAKLDKAGQILVETMDNPSGAKGTFAVWIDGKQKFFQAQVPGLYEAITGSSNAAASYATNAISSILRKGATALRIGATSTPMFMIWNGFRDTFTASFYSKTGLAPIKGTLDGYFLRSDQQLMADFMAQGVPFSTFIGSNKDILKMFLNETRTKTGKDKAIGWAKKPFEFFEHINEATEQAPRLAEFKRTYDQLMKTGNYSEGEALFIAGMNARELTVNFSKMGTSMKTLNQYAAFLNAAVQGNVKILEALGSDAARTVEIIKGIKEGRIHPKTEAQKTWNAWRNGDINFIQAVQKAPMGTTLWGLTEITLPCIALWAINHNKDWYKNLSYDEKMKNVFIEITDGVIIRLPKPEMLGYMLGSIPERMLDAAYDQDPEALLASSAGKFLLEAYVPEITPTALLPLYEWRGNINFFRDRPIEDAKAQQYLVEDRYDIYTSEMAKYAGKTLGLSPMKIDNAFRDVTGSLGSFFLGVTDMALKDKKLPSKDWRDVFRLTYNPTPNSRSRTSEVFYNHLEKLSQKFKSDNLRGKTKKPRELKIYEQARKELVPFYKEQKLITNGLGKYANMSEDDRGKARDSIRYKIDEIQRKANNKAGYKYVPNYK